VSVLALTVGFVRSMRILGECISGDCLDNPLHSSPFLRR